MEQKPLPRFYRLDRYSEADLDENGDVYPEDAVRPTATIEPGDSVEVNLVKGTVKGIISRVEPVPGAPDLVDAYIAWQVEN